MTPLHDRILALWDSGTASPRALARASGAAESTVYRVLKLHRPDRPPLRSNPRERQRRRIERNARVRALWDLGDQAADIARETGIALRTVYHVIQGAP